MPNVPIVLLMLVGCMLALKWWQKRVNPHPELARKLMHIATGLVALTFPVLLQDSKAVWLACSLAIIMLLLQKFFKPLKALGSVLNSVERVSLGDVYFLISIALIYQLAPEPIYFMVPVLVLTLADALAALIGVRYGQTRYFVAKDQKSLEGSAAFFLVAFLSTHIPLLLSNATGRLESLLIAVLVGLVIMIIEAISWEGLDNLFIPYGTLVVLRGHVGDPPMTMVYDLLGLLGIALVTISLRKKTRLDHGGLMAAILMGFIVYSIAGVKWLVAPVILLVCYIVLRRPLGMHSSSVKNVAVVCIPPTIWMLISIYGMAPVPTQPLFYVYSLSIATQAAAMSGRSLPDLRQVMGSVPLIVLLFFTPYLALGGPFSVSRLLVFVVACLLPAVLSYRLRKRSLEYHSAFAAFSSLLGLVIL
ncbi:diacylglycerol/polyprenol kinase family protein [Deinococcus cellulosilyticus]|uniref:Phosphatidate cytidylyltransferase n=1 Tax=Deinococcus cellulosilyticus (strain DSM 18568 / NBRC 106333 / KACC 11606 / 5516J-15) TaxID=1223518 RepID=A0A511MYZ9_DEIC1|nr:hypothetical protein [Deinococcus cellulosilyticus]GEM45835.1 hypothetical protein DC3_14700 [Deinococcus cellulosilyticus NBRC 106333 = KACC 11606]